MFWSMVGTELQTCKERLLECSHLLFSWMCVPTDKLKYLAFIVIVYSLFLLVERRRYSKSPKLHKLFRINFSLTNSKNHAQARCVHNT